MSKIDKKLKIVDIVPEEVKGNKVTGKIKYDDEPIRKLKAEVSRKASMANKRLRRLENNNLTHLPAYQQWIDYKGGVNFSVAGKDYNQLQAELARVNRFIDAKTSLVRQANAYLKDVAEKTGIQYSSVKELPEKTKTFFDLASKVEQYLRNVEGSASAIGYQKIWQVINEYVEDERLELNESKMDMDRVLEELIELAKYDVKDGMIEFEFEGWINVD